jgi:hypothetical protein
MLVEMPEWSFNPLYPGETGEQLYQRVKDGDPATVAWLRKEQAELTAKKLVVGMELGLELVSPGNLTDWPEVFGGKNWAYQGMVDGGVWDYDPEVHAPRPVFHTYRLLVEKLAGYSALQRLHPAFESGGRPSAVGGREQSEPGGPRLAVGGRLHAYRFVVDGRPRYLLWYDDDVAQLPEEPEPAVTVTLPVATTAVTVTHIITAVGQTEPLVEALPVVDGAASLTVGETPLFVEGDTMPCPRFADFNCDGRITVADIMAVAGRWNTRLGEPDYAADFDLDRDGDTDVVDVMWVAARWGERRQ